MNKILMQITRTFSKL